MLMLLNSTCKTRSIQHGRLKMEKHYIYTLTIPETKTHNMCIAVSGTREQNLGLKIYGNNVETF